jgi:hypothetical protein
LVETIVYEYFASIEKNNGVQNMNITENTRVFDILREYGDIAGVMAVFGTKPVGRYSIRRIITRFLSVRMAARIHRVPLNEFLVNLRTAVEKKSAR